MLPQLIFRTLRSANKRCIAKFCWNFGVKGMLSVEKFKRRIRRGEYFPPFLYLSILSTRATSAARVAGWMSRRRTPSRSTR